MQSWALCFHCTFNVFLTCEIFCQFGRGNNKTKNFISQEFKCDDHSENANHVLCVDWSRKALLVSSCYFYCNGILLNLQKHVYLLIFCGLKDVV